MLLRSLPVLLAAAVSAPLGLATLPAAVAADPLTSPTTVRLPGPAPAAKATQATGKRRALLVGIRQAVFKGVPQTPLHACVVDATTLATALRARDYSCEVVTDDAEKPADKPTVEKIKSEVAAISGQCGAEDQLIVYISTHGGFDEGKSIVIATDGAVDLHWIKRHMAASNAKVKILILDCCRDNTGFERQTTEVRDLHVILACRPDEASQVGQSGMSVFTEAMLDGLEKCQADRTGDNLIELDELLYFLDREVPARAKKLDESKPQNPTRTVVDPKVLNPVIASCRVVESLELGPAAYRNTPASPARADLAMVNLLYDRFTAGMTVEQVEKAARKAFAEAPTFDQAGAGVGLIRDVPRPGNVLVARFTKRTLSSLSLLSPKNCQGEYQPTETRARLKLLLGERPLAELDTELKGLAPKDIQAKLGCASAALLPTAAFTAEMGELRYPNVPRAGQMMAILIKDGVYHATAVVPLE